MDKSVNDATNLAELNGVASRYDVEYTHLFVVVNHRTEPLRSALAARSCPDVIVETEAAIVYRVSDCTG